MADYTVLARKYRPQSFEDMVGQKHVLAALINALETGRLHHAYLLTGTRGVGKTTIARILAKCFNCEKGITAHPCGECESCRAIANGNYPDLIEIDAASRTKVEDTREILENVQYKPIAGRYKVYLIDEVHMLSTSSFNALLKTLEEPPEYVKFILATTDPQKLPVTVVSRCLQFQLKALSIDDIKGQLKYVLDEEKISYEEDGLVELARAARGSMRDALSLTDQAIALGGGKVTLEGVYDMVGTLDSSYLIEILKVIATNDGAALSGVLNTVASVTPDFDTLHLSLARVFHDIALYQVAGSKADIYSLRSDVIAELSGLFSPEEVQLYYQIILEGRRELPFAPDGMSAFEMTMLRLLAFNLKKKTAGSFRKVDFPDLALDKINDPLVAFDHLNEQRDAVRQENETQAKQKKQQQSSESHISSETVNGYLNLFDYISLLQKEIDRQDKEIENQYYKITANEQKLQTQKREEEYKQREHALANRIQQDRSSQALQNIPGSTLAGAIQAQTGMNMPSSGDMQYGDGMAPASTQHQQMTAASNASMGPQRPVMSQRRQESNAAPRYIPDNHQQVPVNSWTRSSRNQVNAGHPVQDASHPAVQHEQRQPGRAPAAGNVKQGTVNSSVRMNQPQMPVQSGNVNNNVMSGMVPDYAGGRNIGGYIPESQNGGDYAEQFDDVPMPEYRDFASDSDDEADRANSVDYTSLDLTPSVQNGGSAPSSDAQKNVHHRRKINGREIRMPMDLLGQVSDSYTQDLVAAGVSMENLVILNRGIREFGANENEWIIRLPKVIDGILNRNALSDMAAEISAGLGRKISLKFDFVDAGEIEGSPEALDNQFYEQNLESEKRSIVESEGFAEVQNMLGLDIGEAKIELVQPKTKDQS